MAATGLKPSRCKIGQAGGQRVDLQVAVAPGSGQGRPVRDQGTEDSPAAPGRDGSPAPQAGEIGSRDELHPGRADRLVAGPGHDHLNQLRGFPELGRQPLAEPWRRVPGEREVMHGHHRLHAGLVGHQVQPHAVWQPDAGVDGSRLGDQHQLLVIGREAGRQQPPGQIGRLVVVVELPLDGRAASGEVPHLRGDHGVGGVARELGPGNGRRPRPRRQPAQHPGVGLGHRTRLAGLGVAPDLGIECRPHGVNVHQRTPPCHPGRPQGPA